jgi:hypothetical protein
MPSTQSDALRAHFQIMAARSAANPEMDLPTVRGMLEEVHVRAPPSRPVSPTTSIT